MSSAWRLGLCVVLLAGCGNYDDIRAQAAQLEIQVAHLEAQVKDLRALESRLDLLERLPAKAEEKTDRVALLDAQVLELRGQLDALSTDVAKLAARPPKPPAATGPKTLEPPPGIAASPSPNAGHQVLSVASGSLLLLRGPERLERVELLGVEAPRRSTEYDEAPETLRRHLRALRSDLAPDAAWDLSRAYLESVVSGREVRLRYPKSGPARTPEGALLAYVEVMAGNGGAAIPDLGAALLTAGYVLSAGDHPRKGRYAALELDARRAGAGIMAPPAK